MKKKKTTVDFWTKEEFEKVISTFYIDDLYQHFGFICIWLLFMTGMRLGEATALSWKDIDFENKNLRVNKSLYYKNAKTYEFVEPKTASSIRTIEQDDDTITFLKDWKERQDSIGGMSFVLSYNGIPTSYGHLYPNSLREIANDLTGSIQTNFSKSNLTPETKNQFTAKETK
ncbi:site-specific integrase [Enterococcus lactis]|uniref:site-specific integrase n=1 Tax=Enterococcus lactis TaxID=357441 RepID=UPI003D99058A